MDYPRFRTSTRLVVAGVFAAGLVAACSDSTRSPVTEVSSPPSYSEGAPAPQRVAVTATDLHRDNPMDWVGRMHNEMLEETRKEMILTRKTPTDVCERTKRSLAASTEPAVQRIDPAIRHAVLAAMDRKCTRGRSVRNASLMQDTTVEFTVAYYKAVDQVEAAALEAVDPNHFAQLVAPVLDRTTSMNELDAAGVQAQISVSLGSMEYWWDESAFNSYVLQITYDFEQCASGSGEGITIDTGDQIHTCQGGQMLDASDDSTEPRSPTFSYASTNSSAGAARAYFIFAQTDCGSVRAMIRRVWARDRAGATDGALIGMIAGALMGGYAGAVGGAGIGAVDGATIYSATAAMKSAYDYTRCKISGYNNAQ